MSTSNVNPSQHPRLIGFIPPVSESPRYADNPFASREIALAWLSAFWRLFIGRYDTYAHRPLGNGRIGRVPRQLSNEVLWDHLRGNHVLYVYVQHHFRRGVKICVLDVDCHGNVSEDELSAKSERNFSYLEAVWRRLRELGLPVLLENSDGRGGLHLWMFVQNLSNAEAITVAAWMDSLVDRGDVNVERFPRGNIADETHPGLCIRLPGSHHRQYHFSTFWNGEGWINGAAALAGLNEIHPVAANELPEEALRFRAPIPPTRALPTTARQHSRANQAAPPLDVIQEALRCLGSDYYDATRDEWLRVGMGLHSCVRTAAELQLFFDLWASWSRQAPARWNPDAAVRDWDSFSDGPDCFQWPSLFRLAMAEGFKPPTCWHPDYRDQLQVDTFNAVPYEPTPPTGEAVSIDVLRQAVLQSRLDSLGQPGIFLDRSGTGSGKSTADLEIAESGCRILVIVPDHLNTNEIAESAEGRGLSVVRYRKRVYGSRDVDQNNPQAAGINCWNPDADRAIAAGLAIEHTVCRLCLHREVCRRDGYRGQVEASRRNIGQSAVVLMTHRRAQLIDLSAYCRTHRIDYVAVHESLVEFLGPVYSITLEDLHQFQQLLNVLRRPGQFLNQLGVFGDHLTSNSSQFARTQLAIQSEREGEAHQRREGLRVWIRHVERIVPRLEETLTQGASTAVEVDLTEMTFPPNNDLIPELHSLFWHANQLNARSESTFQLGSCDRQGMDMTGGDPTLVFRLLLELTTGKLRRLVRSAGARRQRLVAVSQMELPSGIPVWLCDATADPEILARIVPGLADRTPLMHVQSHHSVLQVPEYDISRSQRTGPNSTIGKAVRHVLRSYPNKQNICVFCHSNHLEGIRSQLPVRVTSRNYFHSAVARGSNSLFGQHDLLVILGTPRAGGPRSVVDRLIQIGDIDAINEPSEWGSQSFQITDRTRATRVIRSSRYGHPLWNAAYNSIVEAELKQIVGRARPVLFEGSDVVVVSSHLICTEFLEHSELSLTASEDRVWQVCRQFEGSFAARDIRRHVPDLSIRTVSLALQALRKRGYIEYCGTGRRRSTRYQLVRRSPDGRGPASDGCEGE